MESKSLGVWPGPRPLANEVGERQPKSLPLGLYCLYRGVVIGGYSSGIKRLLPQPLRRVRHSLPPSLLLLPPSSSLIPLIFSMGKEQEDIHLSPPRPHPLSSACSPLPLLRLPAACPESCLCRCVCLCLFKPAGCRFDCPQATLLSSSVAAGCVVASLVL